jgi:uncharacterized coiled-coil protein SlyX
MYNYWLDELVVRILILCYHENLLVYCTSSVIAYSFIFQLGRLSELEDALAEQDNAMAAMSAKIKQKDDENANLRVKLQQITKQHATDKDLLKISNSSKNKTFNF